MKKLSLSHFLFPINTGKITIKGEKYAPQIEFHNLDIDVDVIPNN